MHVAPLSLRGSSVLWVSKTPSSSNDKHTVLHVDEAIVFGFSKQARWVLLPRSFLTDNGFGFTSIGLVRTVVNLAMTISFRSGQRLSSHELVATPTNSLTSTLELSLDFGDNAG